MDSVASIDARLDQAARACARDGGTLTDLRRAVLRLILQASAPPTAYQLLDRLKPDRPGAAPPTVYRALDFLLAHGLIHRIERLSAFVGCVGDGHNHQHPAQFLICRSCGAVEELEDAAITRALAAAAGRKGFAPRVALVELEGTCALCAKAA